MAQPANPPSSTESSERRRHLNEAIAALSAGLACLDLLGLDSAATHVSFGLEIARREL